MLTAAACKPPNAHAQLWPLRTDYVQSSGKEHPCLGNNEDVLMIHWYEYVQRTELSLQ